VAKPENAWFLEDVMKDITLAERLGMLAAGFLLPAGVIRSCSWRRSQSGQPRDRHFLERAAPGRPKA